MCVSYTHTYKEMNSKSSMLPKHCQYQKKSQYIEQGFGQSMTIIMQPYVQYNLRYSLRFVLVVVHVFQYHPPPPRQKVTLWQHADKLEQEQVAKGTWINEKSIPECMGCGITFSVFNRKVGDLWATLLPHFKAKICIYM